MGTGIKILKKEMRWTLQALLVYILVPLIVNLPYLISGNVSSILLYKVLLYKKACLCDTDRHFPDWLDSDIFFRTSG